MKLKIISTQGAASGEATLPGQFTEPVRSDLIKRAVEVIFANSRQPYGASEGAGMRHSANLSRRRHKYRGSYGFGISRVPRKIMSRRGTRFNWVGAVAPGTVGGRRAHPPKAEKIWAKKINKKERRKAIRSAISATILKDLVQERNHVIPKEYPCILNNDFETIKKTKDLKAALDKIGLSEELKRTSERKIRAGKGKARGRKYKTKVGPLLVVSSECDLLKSGKNILGLEVVEVSKLNCSLLAPGTVPGRLTFFTEKAIEKLEKEKLFM